VNSKTLKLAAPSLRIMTMVAAMAFSVLTAAEEPTWRSVENLNAADRALFDPAISTPRDSIIPYIPAEPYPFEAPFTAEEMGYRQSEFAHTSRWDHLIVDTFGVVTSSGYINQGSSVLYAAVGGRPGLMGYIADTKPGEVYGKWSLYDVFPPESEGTQQLWFPIRTDMESRTKMDFFIYTPGLRRVRRQPEPRRDQRFPDNSQTFDDVLGRDAWELDWELIGVDTIYETMRFPSTRPTITLNVAGQGFVERQSASLKMMGDSFEHYRADGGVDCWVLKATMKPDWLPDYSEKYLVFWLEKNTFFPLRIEKYGLDGRLMMVESRLGDKQNPARGDFGYASFASIYWNIDHDLIGYSFHDGHTLREWTDEEEAMIFTAEFMRREWLLEPLKSQALIYSPEEFFLRPNLYPDKFPGHRNPTLPPDVETRYREQEAAGKLVFEDPGAQSAP
jgi:hypothetical protein